MAASACFLTAVTSSSVEDASRFVSSARPFVLVAVRSVPTARASVTRASRMVPRAARPVVVSKSECQVSGIVAGG
jgi:hypothetical protein